MNLFIQQVDLPQLTLAYTIATSYKEAHARIKKYLTAGEKNIRDAKIYHAEIRTMQSRVVFLYTEAVDFFTDFEKSEIQLIAVEAGPYLTVKIEKVLYQKMLEDDKITQEQFSKEIDDYCRLHNVSMHMPAFPYLAYTSDGKEQIYFPIKKNKAV